MVCKVCGGQSTACMEAHLLGKYQVVYYQCNTCQFIQTEHPYWLPEAYSSAIASLDIGLVQRNQIAAGIIQSIITKWFDPAGKFVDYGGGYGMLVRMMRDRGFDFYRYDTYCENLFAQTFEAIQPINTPTYTLLTAFEVFEHLVDPVSDIATMQQYSNNILFSTALQPTNWKPSPDSWWYVLPETGQHISLYTTKSLQILAEQRGLNFISGYNDMHLMSERPVSQRWFRTLTNWRGSQLYNLLSRSRRPSLLDTDYAQLRKPMSNEHSF
ncbi:MAG: class I SAM-dependent methyltransferase [Pedobacter sp.]|nr:MAG: class I SAM-dependent methyltransferase [Pedobacter sp.]